MGFWAAVVMVVLFASATGWHEQQAGMSSSSGGGAFARGTVAVPAGGVRRTARFGFMVAATAALLSGWATQVAWQRRAGLDHFVGRPRDEFASSLGPPPVARYARTYAGVWAPGAATGS